MPKAGDVRADGFIFRGMNGKYECWLSPVSWAKYKARVSKFHKARREEIYADPERLAEYREYMARRSREQRRIDPVPFMLRAAKARAKRAGVPFNLTREDVVVPKHCPALGIPLRTAIGACDDNSPELDRIVGSRGYVKGNVIVISRRANRIKNNATPAELMKIAKFYAGWSTR